MNRSLATSIVACAALSAPVLAQCSSPEWEDLYDFPFIHDVRASAMYNDGTGSGAQLYLAGTAIFKLDAANHRFLHLPGYADQLGAYINDMVTFTPPSSSQEVLVVAGKFGNSSDGHWNVAAWDGQAWSRLAGLGVPGTNNEEIFALAVFDSGSGPNLYAAGHFNGQHIGIARYDGSSWQSLGGKSIINSQVDPFGSYAGNAYALSVHDDGSGPALYVAGDFAGIGVLTSTTVGQVINSIIPNTKGIARWNGAAWSSVGNAGTALDVPSVSNLFTFGPNNTTPKLYAYAGGLVSWNGSSWSAPLTVPNAAGSRFKSAAVYNDGASNALYLAGEVVGAGAFNTEPARAIYRYDGSSITPVGDQFIPNPAPFEPAFNISHLATYTINGSSKLLVGGYFPEGTTALGAPNLQLWNGSRSEPVFPITGLDGRSNTAAISSFDPDGAGPAPESVVVIAEREYKQTIGGVVYENFAKRTGAAWLPLAVNSAQFAERSDVYIHVDRHPTGDTLYIAVVFPTPTGEMTTVHRLDNNAWVSLGQPAGFNGRVDQLIAADVGHGPQLFAFGSFHEVDGQPIDVAAVWDGSAWSQIGTGLHAQFTDDPFCEPLKPTAAPNSALAFSDGVSTAIYVLGTYAEGFTLKWDGFTWSDVGAGMDYETRYWVYLAGSCQPPPGSNYGRLFSLNGTLYALLPAFGTDTYTINFQLFRHNGTRWTQESTPQFHDFDPEPQHFPHPIGIVDRRDGSGQTLLFKYDWHRPRFVGIPDMPPRPSLFEFNGTDYIERPDIAFTISEHGNQDDGPIDTNSVVSIRESDQSASLWFASKPGRGVLQPVPFQDALPYTNVVPPRVFSRYGCTITANPCIADFNNVSGVTVQDIFDYLDAWFTLNSRADVDGTPGVAVGDIFFFLNHWFAGC